MPRRSADSLATLPALLVPNRRPEPPAGELSCPEAREEWRRIVASMPADWFTPEMWTLLIALCETSSVVKRAARKMKKLNLASKEYAALNRLYRQNVELATRLSTKLKLTAQSRHNHNRARA